MANALEVDTDDSGVEVEEEVKTKRVHVPTPPKSFTLESFEAYLEILIKARRYDQAAKYFVQSAPELAKASINLKERFNHFLFLPRLVQAGGHVKHGYRKLLSKVRSITTNIGDIPLPPESGFVELGCGAHDPISLSTYFYVNGFSPTYAIDLLTPRNEVYSALSMYDVLANIKMFPGRYARPGVRPKEILDRLRAFDAKAFEDGDFWGGIAGLSGQLNFESVDIVESSIKPESIGLLASFAVLEHVSDIDQVCAHLMKIMRPGGVIFHFVDLADHRSYRAGSEFGPLSFLYEEEAPENMNRLRAPEITEAHRRAGFEIINDVRETSPLEAGRLVPRFQAMPAEDVAAIKQRVVVRKPA